ncbi:MAG: hypothetical protein F6J93_01520 [Oscillatoria sp. SIO1A7]|nr:hypothetical protein [Oscillatoria sp. SIO1A7]
MFDSLVNIPEQAENSETDIEALIPADIAVSYQLSAVSSQQKSCNHCNRAFVTVLTLTGSAIFCR